MLKDGMINTKFSMIKNCFLIFTIMLLCSCENKIRNTNTESVIKTEEADTHCSCPHALIYIQPYGSFTIKQVESFIPSLEENMNKYLYGGWTFKILDPIAIPFPTIIDKKYKASGFLTYLKKLPLKENEVVIGVTHEDICTDIHGQKNYGIVGYSYRPGTVAVVSDKRLPVKSDIWKPVLHEFIHAFYGAKHCPNDDPTCFMVDAKGHGNFRIQNKLCDSCRQ
jgi:predicted Zn-dependent protease